MDRCRSFAPAPQDSMGRRMGRHEWRDHGSELLRAGFRPPRTAGVIDRGGYFDSRRGCHFEGRREGGRGGVGVGHYDGRREGDRFGHRRDGGHFAGRSEGGHFGGRGEVGHSDGRREGGYFDSRREGGYSDGRREGGHFDGRMEDGHYNGKLDNGERRHFGPSSGRGKREEGVVKSGVWGKSRKPEIPKDGWGATLRLSNIPDWVRIGRLRNILEEKGVLAGLAIKQVREGSGLVSFVEDSERVVEMLGKLKIDDCLLQIEVVQTESVNNSGEIKTKPTVEKKGNKKKISAVCDQKTPRPDSNNEKPSLDSNKELISPDSDKKKQSPVSNKKKRKPDSNKKKLSPDSNKKKLNHDSSSKVPQNVKDAEAVFKETIGLFVPDSYEIRDGKLMLVYSMEMDILEEVKGKLDKVLEGGSFEVLIDPTVEILPDQRETSKDESSKASEDNLQDSLKTVVPNEGEEIVDQTVIDDQCKGKEEQVCEEEASKEEVEAEPLQQVEVVFASMDVREKQKLLEQAKQKSLGDFMITAKPKQGQIKKKKKRKPANAEQNLVDDEQKDRSAGH